MIFTTNCSANKAKWAWIQTALEQTNTLNTNVDDSTLRDPVFESHPFLSVHFQRSLDRLSDSYLSAENELTLLADRASSDEKLKLIKEAKSTIFLSTFLLVCDDGGKVFLEALADAAKRGVDVRVLIDGSVWSSVYGGRCPESYQTKGVKIARSNYSFLFPQDDMKLHDKLFIVDAQTAITGGQNIGSNWADSTGLDDKFRDTDVLVRGPVVNDIAHRFVRLWKTVHPVGNELGPYETMLNEKSKKYLELGIAGIHNYPNWLNDKNTKGLCRFVGQDPQLGTHHVYKVYAELARASKRRIVFHVPSLNGLGSPEQEGLLAALTDMAHLKNVRVDVITNGPGLIYSNIMPKSVGWAYGIFTLGQVYESVKETSLNVYTYNYWIHSKLVNFDGVAVAIGSFNFDETGMDWMENTLICIDKDLSKQTHELLVRDFSHSRLLPKAAL